MPAGGATSQGKLITYFQLAAITSYESRWESKCCTLQWINTYIFLPYTGVYCLSYLTSDRWAVVVMSAKSINPPLRTFRRHGKKNWLFGQDEYVKKLNHIPLRNDRTLDDKLSPAEVTQARQLIGQLNWLATQTRPDLSYDVSALSSLLKLENTDCVRQINRTVKKVKKEKSQIDIPSLGNPSLIQIVAYSDASFANLNDGGSQGVSSFFYWVITTDTCP